ncbi:MAG: class I SAM-dependent methyltransferase [Candidatus Methylumidiphilus sp.]
MKIEFTGERCIPNCCEKSLVDTHIERYKFATQYVKGKTVLDIACGVGYGSVILGEAGAVHVDGVDISSEAVNYAKSEYNLENVQFHEGDITSFSSPSKYDVITCFETIEHVDDYVASLSNLYGSLKTGGCLIISSPYRVVTSPLAKSLADKPVNKFHVREFMPDELKASLVQCGFLVNEADIFGQRLQVHLDNAVLYKIYHYLFEPAQRSSPVVSRLTSKWLLPRIFVLIAIKL